MKTSIAVGAAAAFLLSSIVFLWPSNANSRAGGAEARAPQDSSAGRAPESSSAAGHKADALKSAPRVERALGDTGSIPQDDAQKYSWPSGSEVPVHREFDNLDQNWLPGHRGVDLAMAEGQDVVAAGAGKVVYAGRINDRNLVSIEHANGLRTTYEPVAPAVKRGDMVARGQNIGTLESGHVANASVLHWGAKYPGDKYIDPLSLVDWSPIRLWK